MMSTKYSKSRTMMILLLLCYQMMHIKSQQCLSLKGSTACGMFPTAKISIRDSKNVALPWLVNVSTLSEFDHQLFHYVNSTPFWNSELGCSSTFIHNRARYAVSLTCASIVFNSLSSSVCNPDNNTTLPIPLCQSSCESYSKSVEAIIHSSPGDSICHINTNNLITSCAQSLSQQCKTNEGLKGMPSTGCISAADHEISMCGFGDDLNTLCKYCNDYDSTISCCQEYRCLRQRPAAIGGAVIGGIVAGIVGGLSLCALIACCIIQHYKKKKRRLTYPNDYMYTRKPSKDTGGRIPSSYHIPHSSTFVTNTPETHMMRNVYPIDDDDYMEILPDIHMNIDAESVKGHVFKVNSIEKQFVRCIHPVTSPENPDELELLMNDIIRLYYYFDDGWAFGDNFGSGLRGLFPLLCVVNLTPEEVHELLYLSELPDDELSDHNDLGVENNTHGGPVQGDQYYSSIRHFSTGVQYDLDPRSTVRLQNLRRTLTYREKSHTGTLEENNFHYLCAASLSMSPIHANPMATCEGVPPARTASMHASFSPRRSNIVQDPLHMQDEDYFRSESSGSTAMANSTPDSKTYLNGY